MGVYIYMYTIYDYYISDIEITYMIILSLNGDRRGKFSHCSVF